MKIDQTAASLGVDVFIAGCHKWIFGPRGTGLIWANAAGWAVTGPSIPTFDGMWRAETPDRMPRAGQMTPLLRASLGARAGFPLPPRHRQGADRPTHPRPERTVQARPFAGTACAAAHAVVR